MPVRQFEVVVSTDGSNEWKSVAQASQYLAYADQTDTFGYLADIIGVDYSAEQETVSLEFEAPHPSEDEMHQFMDEMVALSRVEEATVVSRST